jgi:hypothetical protein
VISIAELMISGESELAQITVASTPCLPVKSLTRRFQSGSDGLTTRAAPAAAASSFAFSLMSMPITTQPAAFAMLAQSWPTRPRP